MPVAAFVAVVDTVFSAAAAAVAAAASAVNWALFASVTLRADATITAAVFVAAVATVPTAPPAATN